MYGLWLFKEIQTEYGYCKVDIYRKGYSGSQIEIGALAANSLTISLENLSEITAPIGKSVCSFEIIDTDQINYDDFFTPDATALKVVVSTKVGNGAYVTRWSGYVTPDFFAENLTYRTPISISARDNIGYLNDVDFDMVATTTTVRNLIQSAFKKIANDYPMSVVFATEKQTTEGIKAIDATISTALLIEGSWYEALEVVLHDLGLQMRWVDNNTIAVMDLSQIPEYYATQSFNFIHASGYREILPAWRELSQSQDFGLRENFFDGWLNENNIAYVKTEAYSTPEENYAEVRYYVPQNWGVARNIYTTNPQDYKAEFGNKIYFSAVSEDNPSTTYMSWQVNVQASSIPLTIKCNALNTVVYPYKGGLRKYDPFLIGGARGLGDFLQIGIKANLFLHTGSTTYVMRNDWEVDNGTGSGAYINYTLDKVLLDSYTHIEGKGSFPNGVQPSEKEITLVANTIPYDGVLEFRIYGYYIVDYKFKMEETGWNPHFDKFFTVIDNLTFTFNNGDAQTGVDTNVSVGDVHNVKSAESYVFGQIPANAGGINAYAGGLYNAADSMSELIGFQRNSSGSNYNLLELVGREIIHFNKKNYNKLSGTIKNLDKEPLMFNKLFVREGKTYAPFAYSLNVISNEMEVTTMQEVEPYTTASFTQINSEVSTGGATVGGGNNTVLQYSEEAGNVRRVFELDMATEEEKKDAYLLIDNNTFPQARKIPISDVNNFWNKVNVGTEEEPVWAIMPKDIDGKSVGIITKSFITFGGPNPNTNEGGGSGAGTIAFSIIVNGAEYKLQNGVITLPNYPIVPKSLPNPYALKINNVVYDGSEPQEITIETKDVDLTGYATEDWISQQGFLKQINREDVVNALEYVPQKEITEGNKLPYSLISGTPTSLKNPYSLTITAGSSTIQYDGSDNKSITITASSLGALTKHQDISHLLTIENAKKIYQPVGNYTTEDELNSFINSVQSTYATKSALNAVLTAHNELREEFDSLSDLLNSDVSGRINTWNEVVNFLDEYSGSQDLATILSGINADVAKRAFQSDLTDAVSRIAILEGTLKTEQGYIDTLQGYFSNGIAKKATADANGNNIAETYATIEALNTVSQKVNNLDNVIGVDDKGNVYIKKKADGSARDLYTYGAISFGGYGESSSGGGNAGITAFDIYIGGKGPYSLVNGRVDLPAYPAVPSLEGYATELWVSNNFQTRGNYLSAANGVTIATDQTITGIKTFKNGFIVGATPVSEKSKNNTKYIEIDGNLVVTGSISFGGYGESSGDSSSGGLTQFKVVVNGQTYTSQGDTVTISEQFAKSSDLNKYQLASTAINKSNIGSQSVAYAANAGTLGGKTFGQWSGVASNAGGVLEIGRYIDFHYTSDSTADYDTRIQCGGATGNKITLPTANGTLALTSDLADYQPLDGAINTDNIGSQSVNYANSAGKLSNNSAYTAWGQTFFSNGVPKSISGALSDVTSIDASGTATVDAIVVSSTSAKAHLTFSRSGINYFATASSGGAFGFVCGGNSIQTVNADLVIEEGYLYPGSTGATSMGRSSKRWSSVYSVDGNFSGSVSMGGNLVVSGSITFGSASDRRLKSNVHSMMEDDAISVLKALNPVTFQWNATANELGKLRGVCDGFIADEYEKLIPNSGRDIWGNYRAIDYTRVSSYLVKGWQNHETRLEAAERRIRELENELKQYRRA